MGKPRRQVRIPGRKRKRIILEQAMELFSRRGFHGASIDDIAAASNISKPVLYDHFSSKEDLYIQVCKEIRERLLATGAAINEQDVAASIRAGIEAFFVFAEKNPAAIRILLTPPRHEKRLYRAIRKIQDEATERIKAMYLALSLGSLKDEAASQRLTIQVEFIKRGLHALGQWRVEHPSVPRGIVVDAISELICQGLPRQS